MKIDLQKNDKLSSLRGQELQEFLTYLDDFYLTLRDKINIDSDTTFSLEIEFENANTKKIESKIINIHPKWIVEPDSSLHHGKEVDSPILKDNKQTWQDLKSVCDMIKEYAQIGINSSSNIHIGSHIIARENLNDFLKIYAAYENIIFRFGYGEYINSRYSLNDYAAPVSLQLQYYLNKNMDNLFKLPCQKYDAINTNKVVDLGCYRENNTIEFRFFNGSLDPAILQNNVNLIVKLLNYSRDKNYADDIIDKRMKKNEGIYNKLDFYGEIFIDQALEFADLIFDNNLDKLYFLRQYFKSLEVGPYKKAKTFTK